jgi:hypothetical protein
MKLSLAGTVGSEFCDSLTHTAFDTSVLQAESAFNHADCGTWKSTLASFDIAMIIVMNNRKNVNSSSVSGQLPAAH